MQQISDETVQKTTGKTWKEWIDLLNKAGAKDWPHKDIARWLHDEKHIASSWWCQSVTVGYEYAIGRRVVGETADAGYEIGVTKTIPFSPQKIWNVLVSPEGRKIWLGDVKDFTLEKGFTYTTTEGITGEIRSIDIGKKIRLTYQPKGADTHSTIQIYILPTKEKTSLHFHQEKLADTIVREHMRVHWKKVLTELEALLHER